MDGFLGYLEVGFPFGGQKFPQCGQLNLKSTFTSHKWAMTKILKKRDVLLSSPKVVSVTNKQKYFSKKVHSGYNLLLILSE